MRKLFSICVFLVVACNASGQVLIDCSSGRYDQEVFQSVLVTAAQPFGASVSQSGANQVLYMDVYEPAGDTALQRPLIVWAHGGSFVGGTRSDPDIVQLCNSFAKRGYVCVSIDYRLGVSFPPSETSTTEAVFRAVQDMKAAVRYFRKDAATADVYRIDPDQIYAGGSSAGAFTAMHMAYLDDPSELPAVIDTTALGGLEGNSGNPGYSSEVKAVVNLCGALGDKTWMYPGDEPLCSMHGTADGTVPYSTSMIYFLGIFPIMVIDGSYALNEYADQIGLPNVMYTYFGADHVPYLSNAAYMDTTVRFVSNFLYGQLGCTPSDPNPLPNTFGSTTGITGFPDSGLEIYPNPAYDVITIRSAGKQLVRLLNITGDVIHQETTNLSGLLTINTTNFTSGIYILQVISENRSMTRKIQIR